MSEIEMNEIKQNLPDPFPIASNLNSLTEQFNSVLDDFKKYYILYHSAPQSNEYAQMFATVKGNIQSINSQLFSQANNIESATQQANQTLNQLNTDIQEAKITNTSLKQKLNLVETSKHGASEMSENYKIMYNLQYFSNFTMLLGIVIAGGITYNIFKK